MSVAGMNDVVEDCSYRNHGTSLILSTFVIGDGDDEAKTQCEHYSMPPIGHLFSARSAPCPLVTTVGTRARSLMKSTEWKSGPTRELSIPEPMNQIWSPARYIAINAGVRTLRSMFLGPQSRTPTLASVSMSPARIAETIGGLNTFRMTVPTSGTIAYPKAATESGPTPVLLPPTRPFRPMISLPSESRASQEITSKPLSETISQATLPTGSQSIPRGSIATGKEATRAPTAVTTSSTNS